MNREILDQDAQGLLDLYGINGDDLAAIRALGKVISPKLDTYGQRFYDWVVCIPEYQIVFTSPEILAHARAEQISYWRRCFLGVVDNNYIEHRRKIGQTHARVGLSLPSYLVAMSHSFSLLTQELYDGELPADQYTHAICALTKLVNLDITVVSDTYTRLVNERVAMQSKALLEMSTPVTQIWQDILMLPMVGIIDSRRAQDVMMTVLTRIAETRAKVFIMDISGVAVVDSAVANHLIKITKSTGLMGCTSMVSGISPAIAQTMVNLGFDVREIATSATLRDALEHAFQLLGRKIT